MTREVVRGYKGFNKDMTCWGFQYEVGQTYEMEGYIEPYKHGFHFCRNAADVLNYYGRKGCRYAEVEALGDVINKEELSVTNKLRITRKLTLAEIMDIMYTQEGLDFKDTPFPADEILQARGDGTLGEMLPSGTEFPVTFTNGEKNVLVVCRDRDHTYLITKYIMAELFAMNPTWTNKDGWPACGMRKHVQEIYDMLPEDVRRVIIPMHIRQAVQRGNGFTACDDPAFLLSAVNVFGKKAWHPEADCKNSQIDIFQRHFFRKPANRLKRRPGASSTSWWWLRSAFSGGNFTTVYSNGSITSTYAYYEGGVVVGFCIETRN